jgi:hypothetical protein
MNITQKNLLIARFMGIQVKVDMMGNDSYRPDLYWENLMPVVEKIEQMNEEKFDYVNYDKYQKVLALHISCGRDVVYKAVVEFIKWYNENK